jgi:hypothetical protein
MWMVLDFLCIYVMMRIQLPFMPELASRRTSDYESWMRRIMSVGSYFGLGLVRYTYGVWKDYVHLAGALRLCYNPNHAVLLHDLAPLLLAYN